MSKLPSKFSTRLIQHFTASPPLRKSYEFLSRVPIVNPILQKFLRFILPSDFLVWAVIRFGPGKGVWIHLNPRFDFWHFQMPFGVMILQERKPDEIASITPVTARGNSYS